MIMKASMSFKNIGLFVVLLSALFLAAACNNNAKTVSVGPAKPMPYKTAEVYTGPSTMYYSFPATIQGEQDVEIRPKVDGFIEKIFVDEGASVHMGQRLFKLRNP